MRYYLYICVLIGLSSLLSAEIITDANQIRKLQYADGLKRNGLATGYYLEFIRENSLNTHAGHFFSVNYGLSEYFDAGLKVPYYVVNQDSARIDGMGDVGLGLKFNLNPRSDGLFHSLLGQITLPTGYDKSEPDLNGMLSFNKKSFELDYLISYRKDFLAVHGNIGLRVLDNIANRQPEDLTFNYKFGFDYRLTESKKRSWWLKWEFETIHSLTDFDNSIQGSQFLGFSEKVEKGFAMHAGVIQQIYHNDALGFQVGLSYLLPGTLRERPKKLFELYPKELKVGLLEFIKDDTLRTMDYLSAMLEEHLGKTDSIKVVLTPKGSADFLANRDKVISTAKNKGQSLVIFGKIVESSFKRSNLFRLPPLIMLPEIEHRIGIEIIVIDSRENKIVLKDQFNAQSSLYSWPRLFTVKDRDEKWFLSAGEEHQLIRQNSAKITREIAAALSANY